MLKLGIEKKNFLSKKFILYHGADAFGMFSSEGIGNTDRSEIGVDGVFGFQWLMNNRMALSTEGYLSFSYLNQDTNDSDLEGFLVGITIPRSLYFSFFF